jgi:isoleucyl-tRNA synthetase
MLSLRVSCCLSCPSERLPDGCQRTRESTFSTTKKAKTFSPRFPIRAIRTLCKPSNARFSTQKQTTKQNKSTSEMEDLPTRVSFPAEEEKTLEFWKQIDAFKTQLELTKDSPRFTFYDGPPFATGLPHYGHLLAGTIKDIVTRYATTTGHFVERRFGWDTHGLPVEFEIDKKLGITGPADVEAMGIDKYNAECRAIVMRYAKEWESTVVRMGRWIDFENDYKTLNTSFMESVWWVFAQLYGKGQVYRGFKIMPYSTACATPLSNFEANQNYKDAIDPAVTVAFPVVGDEETELLAWTTTPWTLPSNLALCVNPEFDYVKIKDGETGKHFILLEKRLDVLYKDLKKAKFEVLQKYKGKELVGWTYQPLFSYFSGRKSTHKTYVVVSDSYVTDDSGTGIVHQAPGFGEDDFRVAAANGIINKDGTDVPCPIDASGRFMDEVLDFKGLYVKDADKLIVKFLKDHGRLVRHTQLSHSYPFCWRSDTPLVYRAVPSWFVRVTDIVDKLMKNNARSYWVPESVQEKRFANWLENARDWAISRNRYWGTPIPLWTNEDYSEIVCVGSVEELERLSGVKGITDLHRDSIDGITIQGKTGVLKRIPEVLDCWFESGSMPYAQSHYPFENKETFEQNFPADFIAEGLDQTRGWFYTLLVLSTHLFDKPPFKNVIVNGLVLASDGKKMSKRLKNYPEPTKIVHEYGADALRLYLINSPVVRAETLKFKEEGVRELVSSVFLPWYNANRFFASQVMGLNKDFGVDFVYNPDFETSGFMDKWILARCQSLIAFVRQEMAAYRLYTVVPRLLTTIDELTNWYIRFNRKRLKGDDGVDEATMAMNTLCEVLFTLCRIMAPFTPFMTESIYQSLKAVLKDGEDGNGGKAKDARSVHFLTFPTEKAHFANADIERRVGRMQKVIELGRAIRDRKTIPLKTPLSEIVIISPDQEYRSDVESLERYISEELNVRSVVVTADEDVYGVKYKCLPDAKGLGQRLKKEFQKVANAAKTVDSNALKTYLTTQKINLAGFELGPGDLHVVRFMEEGHEKYEADFELDVLVLMNCEVDDELKMEGIAREIVNRVQRLRKKVLFLVFTDNVRLD